ncbi:MAG: protein-L-isoaspartate(D-aspartate) O-methyltransferase [Pirellulaceae bacterium]|nr:protein-L-isoaspartate(D-aspartate) O-methyltransferase [Pirellulaceae bacterium]
MARSLARSLSRILSRSLLTALALLTLTGSLPAQRPRSLQAQHELMVEMVREGVDDPRVLKSVADTQRHLFVPSSQRKKAYLDLALPIGHSATISPPYIVAYMTEQLRPRPTDRVLEIGTGSGYQAAILSPLVKEVYTIEIVEPLGKSAASRLQRLGYKNVKAKVGDGFKGWPEHAPFDKIIVTCSPENIPQPLIDQLRDGGRMVIPLGGRYQQSLCLVSKKNGKLTRETLESTFFIPMTGRAEELRADKTEGAATILNGDFEAVTKSGGPLRWYYLRQHRVVTPQGESEAPAGDRYLKFANETPGRMAQALQAFGVDGRRHREIQLSAWVRTADAAAGENKNDLPSLQVRFYDDNRKNVGVVGLGPFSGTSPWTKHEKKYRIPRTAKLAVVGVGLFGGIGEASFDDVHVEAREKVSE